MSIADELRKLAELRNSGVLSDTEFEAQKKRLLEPIQPGEQVQVPEATDQLFERRVISLVTLKRGGRSRQSCSTES